MQMMMGRNGVDELARMLSFLGLFMMIFDLFFRTGFLTLLALIVVILSYARTFSKNIAKRRAENQKYLAFRYKLVVKWNKLKNRIKQRKHYRFYACPTCKQKVRVPKGHGKIEITCPKCREKFIKHT